MIEKGQVSVSGERVREPGRDVPETAAVAFDPNLKALPKARSTLPVLYEDEHVIVVDKPAGLLSVPSAPGLDEDTASRRVQDYARRLKPHGGYAERVHRLDRDTSGALAFALSRDARAGLIDTFRAHRIERRYLAIVEGLPRERARNDRRARARGVGLRPPRRRGSRRGRAPRAHALGRARAAPRRGAPRGASSRPGVSTRCEPTSPTRACRSSAIPCTAAAAARRRPLARRPMLHAPARLRAPGHGRRGRRRARCPPPEDFRGRSRRDVSRAAGGATAAPRGRARARISRSPIGESSKWTPTWNESPSRRAHIAVPGTSTDGVRAPSWIGASKTTATVAPRGMSSPTLRRQP